MELYIHIPFCMKKCDYCDFLSAPWPKDVREAYANALCREIDFFGKKLKGTPIDTIYIGGGTPTWLEAWLMGQIMEEVHRCFEIAEDAEISMECNPGTASYSSLSSYRTWGLNRLSIGLQSAVDKELSLLGRIHDKKRFIKTFENARRCGISNINVDIMTGIPSQTQESLLYTIEEVLRLNPEHISAYALMIEEGTPFYDRYHQDDERRREGLSSGSLPDEDEEYMLSKLAQNVLSERGYTRYEISNYARDGLICRHNAGYWTREPYLGLGLGAASLLGDIRCSNVRDIEEYIRGCEGLPEDGSGDSPVWETIRELSRKDEIEEFMFLGLRMTEGISRFEFQKRFGQPIDSYYKSVLYSLKEQGLIEMEGGTIRLSEQGLDVSNRVLSQFLID